MRRHTLWIGLVLVASLSLSGQAGQQATAQKSAAAPKAGARLSLSDQEFWRLANDFSEPDGTFHSENLVSNEALFQHIVPKLVQTVTPGRAYVGVGSEQNFTYIVATRPSVAFIVDIRRGNLDLQLLYKAFFELSADRADFVSHLFARPRPAGLTPTSSVAEIFDAFDKAAPSQVLYAQYLNAAKAHLQTKHGFTLSAGDLSGLDYVYTAWFTNGPDIRYQLTTGGGGGFGRGGRGGGRGPGGTPTYAALMTATDDAGKPRSYLATEASFAFMKDLQTRNLLIPVVGNFGGPKALRAVASYLKQKNYVVSTFYTSNVEQYLRQDNLWDTFCASAATFPVDRTSTIIRSERGGFMGARGAGGGGFASMLAPMREDFAACAVR